jgi:CHAT domain-containing protein
MTLSRFKLDGGRLAAACLSLMAATAALSPPAAAAPPAPQGDTFALDPGRVVERHVNRNQAHRYQLTLSVGECVDLVVEQRGVDVVIQALDPDGTPIAEFQEELRNRGEEHVQVVSEKAGTYALAIKPMEGIDVEADSSYAIRQVGRRSATPADRAMQEARTLHLEAGRLDKAARFSEARAVLERVLRIVEGVQGSDNASVGLLLNEIAGVTLAAHDDTAAEALYQRALVVLDKAVGPDHPLPAMARSRLGLIYRRNGKYPQSLALLEQASAVLERTVGPEHPWFVRTLVTLGSLFDDLNDFEKAEVIDRRALGILEKLQQTDTIAYADLLNNIGLIERKKRDYVRAEQDMQRSLAIGERLQGPRSLYVSNGLQNLGLAAHDRKDNVAAERYYSRALEIREALLGPMHPDVAQLLNNLGNIYQGNGDTARALEMHFRALRIREKAPYQPRLLASVSNIARIYAASGNLPQALAFQRRADALVERQLQLNLGIGSERTKLALTTGMADRTDRTLSLHLQQAPADSDAASLAMLVLLQRKGRVLDAMTDTFAAVRQQLTSDGDQQLLDQLRQTTADLARVALNTAPPTGVDDQAQQVETLVARKEQLESTLSVRSGAFRASSQPVTLEAVQAALPDDAALIEFAVFRPFDPKLDGDDAYGAPHYAAYVLRKHAAPRGIDLGPAASIDAAVGALRATLHEPHHGDSKSHARSVDQRLIKPLRGAIGDATRLLISPDGNLHLVPFEALIDEHHRFLIEHYAIGYLTSGRDLLRMQVTRASRTDPVIVADPFFGEPDAAPHTGTRAPTRGVVAADDLASMYFGPLSASAGEAQAIKTLFPKATLFLGPKADKAAVMHVEAPSILHIASHAFFLGQARGSAENPLLRSGLALAGANITRDLHGEGILTALEASGLNLWGTRLVTLSACDTGVGEVRNGEGVYGLRRAFVLAGAETLVTSLWPVSDYVTREMMTAYYSGLRAGLGRGEALRHAKLAMLKRPSRRHPFYWASFVQSGEWASLDGRR